MKKLPKKSPSKTSKVSLSFKENVPLKRYCTFSIGGPARYFAVAEDLEDLKIAFEFAKSKKIDYFILGKGSNILFDDRGFDGLVILNKINDFALEGNQVRVGAAYSFSLLGTKTARNGLGGLEFASGIPGTVGGAIFMNAGANGSETADALTRVTYLHENGDLENFQKKDLIFAYRTSPFQKMKGAIVSAVFDLHPSDIARKKQIDLINYRTKTQPYSDHSAGCAFKNPDQMPAGQIIEACGLKGLTVGGAQVSELHGNFIVNKGNASAQDVLQLIQEVQKKVKDQGCFILSEEIRYIPYSKGVKNG